MQYTSFVTSLSDLVGLTVEEVEGKWDLKILAPSRKKVVLDVGDRIKLLGHYLVIREFRKHYDLF